MEFPAAILFDFDGVIANSEPLHFRAFQQTLASEGIALSEAEYYADLIGYDDRGAFRHLLAKHNRSGDEALFHRLLDGKSRLARQMIAAGEAPALAGVREFVTGLCKHDYPLAICSGALRGEIEAMLDGIKLRESFAVIVAAEDVAIGKPDPGGYLLALRLIGERAARHIAPHQALVIEDAPIVIESARGAGFKTLGVATTYPPAALLTADFVVQSLRPAEVVAKIPALARAFG